MQYHVVATQTLIDLEEMCNALICEGWEPQGGISIGERQTYAQAMIKEDEEAERNSARTWVATIFLVFSIINLCIGFFSDNKASLAFSGILIALYIYLFFTSNDKE